MPLTTNILLWWHHSQMVICTDHKYIYGFFPQSKNSIHTPLPQISLSPSLQSCSFQVPDHTAKPLAPAQELVHKHIWPFLLPSRVTKQVLLLKVLPTEWSCTAVLQSHPRTALQDDAYRLERAASADQALVFNFFANQSYESLGQRWDLVAKHTLHIQVLGAVLAAIKTHQELSCCRRWGVCRDKEQGSRSSGLWISGPIHITTRVI